MAERAPRGRLYELHGEHLTLRAWAERYSLPRGLVAVRVSTGWELLDALTTPAGTRGGLRVPSLKRVRVERSALADERIEQAIRDLRERVLVRAEERAV